MSRHSLPCKAPGHTVVVGWDRPMNTFFAQVCDENCDENAVEDEESVVLWLGGVFNEIASPEQMAGPLAPWAELGPDMVATLDADRKLAPSSTATPLQKAFRG